MLEKQYILAKSGKKKNKDLIGMQSVDYFNLLFDFNSIK